MELGRDAEAEASFQQAIAIDNNPEVHNNLGTLWKKRGRLDDAIGAYRQSLAQSPGYANAHYNLGNAYRDRKEMESAAECFRQALNSDPGHASALVALGQVLQALQRAGEAVPILERALVLIQDDADLYCDPGRRPPVLRTLQGRRRPIPQGAGVQPQAIAGLVLGRVCGELPERACRRKFLFQESAGV